MRMRILFTLILLIAWMPGEAKAQCPPGTYCRDGYCCGPYGCYPAPYANNCYPNYGYYPYGYAPRVSFNMNLNRDGYRPYYRDGWRPRYGDYRYRNRYDGWW